MRVIPQTIASLESSDPLGSGDRSEFVRANVSIFQIVSNKLQLYMVEGECVWLVSGYVLHYFHGRGCNLALSVLLLTFIEIT